MPTITAAPVIHFPDGSSAGFNLEYVRSPYCGGYVECIALISDTANYGADADID